MTLTNSIKYVILAVLIALGFFLIFFKKSCVQPSELEVRTAQLQCAQEADPDELAKEICLKLGREENCSLTAEDEDVALEFVFGKLNECSKKKLEQENKCVDKYEEFSF